MNEMQAIQNRHSVRKYQAKPIPEEIRRELDALAAEINEESGLHINIRYDDPSGFDTRLAHYGAFANVDSYIVLAGKDCSGFDEKCGYYGEKIVIRAQMLGLNTCWTAMTFNKKMVKKLIPEGERFCMVIALGYGEGSGSAHKGKSYDKLCGVANPPAWFKAGVEAAMLAPTAVNQQKFHIDLKDDKPIFKTVGIGPCIKVDLGIVKYHFEVGSGRKVEV